MWVQAVPNCSTSTILGSVSTHFHGSRLTIIIRYKIWDMRYEIKDMGSEIWLISYEMWTQVDKIMWYARGSLVWLLVLNYLHAKAQIKCIVCPHLFLTKRKNSAVDVSDASCLTCELISMGSSAPYLGSTCPECGANRRWPDNPFSWKYFSAPVETPDTS